MSEYVSGTTNQGGTIGSFNLPLNDLNLNNLSTNTLILGKQSAITSIDNTTIINDNGVLESTGLTTAQVNTLINSTIQNVTLPYNTTRTVVYLTNGNNVMVLDRHTNTVITNIDIGTGINGMAISPNNEYLYIGGSNGTVYTINTATNVITNSLSIGTSIGNHFSGNSPLSSNVAITPSGDYLYITSGNDVIVVDISTNAITTTITGFDTPTSIAITPNGDYAYVVNDGNNSVSVIDISTNAITTTITVGTNPYGIAITPNGDYAYVTNNQSSSVSVIDISTNAVTTTISVGTGTSAIAITPNGDYAYVVNYAGNSVSVIDISTNAVTTTVSSSDSIGPQGVAITPDGNYAYISVNNGSSYLTFIISTATNKIIYTTPYYDNPGTILSADITQNNLNPTLLIQNNRAYLQDLTASTTTSTTAVALGNPITITPAYSGYIVIDAVVRVNNNTLADGVTVSLLNGTTVLDSETYTQEGLASNSHTMNLHYELQNQTLGTLLTLALNFNAVTGGTASAKIVKFEAKEIIIM